VIEVRRRGSSPCDEWAQVFFAATPFFLSSPARVPGRLKASSDLPRTSAFCFQPNAVSEIFRNFYDAPSWPVPEVSSTLRHLLPLSYDRFTRRKSIGDEVSKPRAQSPLAVRVSLSTGI